MTPETKSSWGGTRSGAGRPRTRPERLTGAEMRLLLDMLKGNLYADQHGGVVEKLERMAQAEKAHEP